MIEFFLDRECVCCLGCLLGAGVFDLFHEDEFIVFDVTEESFEGFMVFALDGEIV